MSICCYLLHCYRGKGKVDPNAVKVIVHSQGIAAVFRHNQQSALPWYVFPEMQQHWHRES